MSPDWSVSWTIASAPLAGPLAVRVSIALPSIAWITDKSWGPSVHSAEAERSPFTDRRAASTCSIGPSAPPRQISTRRVTAG